MSIEDRKRDHIIITAKEDVEALDKRLFEDVELVHNSIPDFPLDSIDLKTRFLGYELTAPIIVAGMTGGHALAKKVNEAIAEAVEELGLGMGVGSQRAALEKPELEDTYSIVRARAPNVPIIGNIGATQVSRGLGRRDVERLVKMIRADAIAVHFNPLQEAAQPEGEPNFDGIVDGLEKICSLSPVPIIAKETGAGFSKEAAQLISQVGISIFDVGGAGGTSFSRVEYVRAVRERNIEKGNIGLVYGNWGIPTVLSIIEVLNAGVDKMVIATGGIRTGLDAAKALRLGASLVGIGRPVIRAALDQGSEGVKSLLKTLIHELRVALYLVGARNVGELRERPVVLSPRILSWVKARKLVIPFP